VDEVESTTIFMFSIGLDIKVVVSLGFFSNHPYGIGFSSIKGIDIEFLYHLRVFEPSSLGYEILLME
jgi:hypothetical protein